MCSRSRTPFFVVLMVSVLSSISWADQKLSELFAARGFRLDLVQLPKRSDRFPASHLKDVRFQAVVRLEWFPEGPSYRPADGSYFFSGGRALTRVDSQGRLREVLGNPGAGGTHFLADGSVLLIGQIGLRRMFPDGRVALLLDGSDIGPGNDLSLGVHGEVYLSVPTAGIYRLTAGTDGRLEKVTEAGCNGLEVDPAGKFLYVVRQSVQRYPIDIERDSLGQPETVYTFPPGEGGGDGNALDDQRDQVRDFANERGIAIVDEFADVGKSAHDRPAFIELIDRIVGRDDFEYVLCLDESRFLRFQDLELLAYCQRHGKQIIYTAKPDICPGRPA